MITTKNILSRILTFTSTFSYKKYSIHNDKLLKHYFSRRFQYSTLDLLNTLTSLNKSTLDKSDQRFKNLITTIDRNIPQFNLDAKIKIITNISHIKLNQNLLLNLIKSIEPDINIMNLKQLSLLLWSLAKNNHKNIDLILKISNRIKQIFNQIREWTMSSEISQKKLQLGQQQEQQQNEQIFQQSDFDMKEEIQRKRQVKPMTCVLLIWSFAKLKITDKQIEDVILKKTVLPNLNLLSKRQLILLLNSCKKLNYKKKDIMNKLYVEIRKDYIELEQESILTLMLLLNTISKLENIQSEFMIWLTQTIINKHASIDLISGKFTTQIIWSLLINKIFSKPAIDLLLKNIINKINYLNDVDCSMLLYVIFQNNINKKYPKQVKQLITRMQKIYLATTLKTKHIIIHLCNHPQFQSKKLKKHFLTQQ